MSWVRIDNYINSVDTSVGLSVSYKILTQRRVTENQDGAMSYQDRYAMNNQVSKNWGGNIRDTIEYTSVLVLAQACPDGGMRYVKQFSGVPWTDAPTINVPSVIFFDIERLPGSTTIKVTCTVYDSLDKIGFLGTYVRICSGNAWRQPWAVISVCSASSPFDTYVNFLPIGSVVIAQSQSSSFQPAIGEVRQLRFDTTPGIINADTSSGTIIEGLWRMMGRMKESSGTRGALLYQRVF
jgi:hypothetical protein